MSRIQVVKTVEGTFVEMPEDMYKHLIPGETPEEKNQWIIACIEERMNCLAGEIREKGPDTIGKELDKKPTPSQ